MKIEFKCSFLKNIPHDKVDTLCNVSLFMGLHLNVTLFLQFFHITRYICIFYLVSSQFKLNCQINAYLSLNR